MKKITRLKLKIKDLNKKSEKKMKKLNNSRYVFKKFTIFIMKMNEKSINY